jgi:hypothetical protein
MSTIWTPGGERPVGRGDPGDEAEAPGAAGADAHDGETHADVDDAVDDPELAAVQRQLADTPAAVVVANHALGLFHLAALHLSQQPPHFDDAKLAIDAMAGVVEGLAGRLGDDEPALADALAQIRLAFVQIKAASGDTPAQ